MNLMYVQMLDKFIQMSQSREMVWVTRKMEEFSHIEPETLVSPVFEASYRGKRMLVYRSRVSMNRNNSESQTVIDFLDDNGVKIGELPRTKGMKELYEEAFYQNRDPQMAELDKVVAGLTELTKLHKVTWLLQPTANYPELDDDVLTSSVYQLDYRGRRFITYAEEGADSGHKIRRDMVALHLVDANGKRIKNLHAARGLDELFLQVRLATRNQGGNTKLDEMVESIVVASLQQVVDKIKAEKRTQANGTQH